MQNSLNIDDENIQSRLKIRLKILRVPVWFDLYKIKKLIIVVCALYLILNLVILNDMTAKEKDTYFGFVFNLICI